jgi:hypothetical protein
VLGGAIAVAAVAILLGELSGFALAKQGDPGSCKRVEADGAQTRVGGVTVVLGKGDGGPVTVRAEPGFKGTIDFKPGSGGPQGASLRVNAPKASGDCTVLASADAEAGGSSNGSVPKRPGMLPYTGPDAPLLAVVGALLILAGALVRSLRARSS